MGIDLRDVYVPREHIILQCTGHKMKCFSRNQTKLLEHPERSSILDAQKLLDVAQKLAQKDKPAYVF